MEADENETPKTNWGKLFFNATVTILSLILRKEEMNASRKPERRTSGCRRATPLYQSTPDIAKIFSLAEGAEKQRAGEKEDYSKTAIYTHGKKQNTPTEKILWSRNLEFAVSMHARGPFLFTLTSNIDSKEATLGQRPLKKNVVDLSYNKLRKKDVNSLLELAFDTKW